jgi:hypothetical protein
MITRTFINDLNSTITVEGQNLIVEFFITFSRFECALKASSFLGGDADRAWPKWDMFVATIRPLFDKNHSPELREAFDYILHHPPRVQMVQGNQLAWRNRTFQQDEPEINKVALSIRDIRNNLFHGGKFQGNFQPDISRNYILLKNAIVVLNDWLRLNDPVRNYYLQPIA